MRVTTRAILCCAAALLVSATASAQTSTPGPAIDVELYDATDGDNSFCAAPGDPVWVYLFVGPAVGGSSSFQCWAPCGTVTGGRGNIATAIVDVGFDPTRLSFHSSFNNGFMGAAAVDGLIQTQNLASGRVGWVLSGDWTPDADPSGSLADPCTAGLISSAGWVVRLAFTVEAPGATAITIRDEPAFRSNFADLCGSDAFTSVNGGIDEVISAAVATGSPACPELDGIIFRNGFELGDLSAWQ